MVPWLAAAVVARHYRGGRVHAATAVAIPGRPDRRPALSATTPPRCRPSTALAADVGPPPPPPPTLTDDAGTAGVDVGVPGVPQARPTARLGTNR